MKKSSNEKTIHICFLRLRIICGFTRPDSEPLRPAGMLQLLFLCSLQIASVAGIYLNQVALVDKQGHAHLHACFQGSGLGGIGSGITLYAWL